MTKITAIALLCISLAAHAIPVTPVITGNQANFTVSLPGGYEVDYELTFQSVIGLSVGSLNITAEVINVNDPLITNRLPSALYNTIPGDLPVMVTIEPPALSGLSFVGTVQVDIHTHNLPYTRRTPLRLFKAQVGGLFHDITDTVSPGSYRARGTTGRFSQFMVVRDMRPKASIITSKMNRLKTSLLAWENSIDVTLYGELTNKVNQAEAAILVSDYATADTALTQLLAEIDAANLADIPKVWAAGVLLDNVAGELYAMAKTLRFTLRL